MYSKNIHHMYAIYALLHSPYHIYSCITRGSCLSKGVASLVVCTPLHITRRTFHEHEIEGLTRYCITNAPCCKHKRFITWRLKCHQGQPSHQMLKCLLKGGLNPSPLPGSHGNCEVELPKAKIVLGWVTFLALDFWGTLPPIVVHPTVVENLGTCTWGR